MLRIITGDTISPLAPLMTSKTEKRQPDMTTWNYKPSPEDEDDGKYMKKYNRFIAEFERYRDKQPRACGTILGNLEPTIRSKFEDDLYDMQPGNLWRAIKKECGTGLEIDGRHGMLLLAQCKPENHPSVTERISAQKKLIDDLENLPKSTEWTNFKQVLTMTGKIEPTTELLSSPRLRSTAQTREGTVIGFSSIHHTSTERKGVYRHIYRYIGIEVENYLVWMWGKRA